jgi:methylmalonyl-CoA mutase N-terminal domain/subunit
VETLTNEMEEAAAKYIHKIDEMGGMIPAIERGFPQREIADASYRYQVAVDRKEKIIVGVNEFTGAETPIEILRIDESVRAQQSERLRKLRAERSGDEVARQLAALRKAARGTENLMPHIYSAVKAYATLGEICDTLREVFGTHEEVSVT